MNGFREAESVEEVRELIDNNKMVFVFLYGEHCSVCHGVLPQIRPMIDSYNELMSIQADIEKLPMLSGEFTVFTVPVVLLFLEGKEVLRIARFIRTEELKERLDKILDSV
ncbi:thioredoxin family protein [Alkalibacterium pelagium]|uniref:Thioredoxin n=1 Tax=Alkalibacterium pelagium TaxID=426702 RepID=A0A1H7FBY4_9LACT|nr:thioredoxin family protein [Alkalibacterium pelagium]GEN49462.1 thioredoxin-like protein YdfQ [Alkalibacterium pelagium]SEK21560.1 Thioredoxin [Alkalibacterium pelagium]